MSNPDPKDPQALEGPCDYIEGLATHYPKFRFQIVNETAREETRKGIKKAPVAAAAAVGVAQSGFGLTSDRDKLWTKDREVQKDQVREGEGEGGDGRGQTRGCEGPVYLVRESGITPGFHEVFFVLFYASARA